MKKFHFNLQALLTLRQRQEQIALEQYGQAIAARHLAFENLEVVTRHCAASWALCRQEVARGATPAQVMQTEAYCFSVEDQKKKCEAVVEQAQRVVDDRWHGLVLARQQREAVDKYRERQLDRYERELQREEQAMLDDLVKSRVPMATDWKRNPEEARN